MNKSILNLNDSFRIFFIISDEPSLARNGRHGIAMAIDGAPWNVMTIGELQWSLSTGTFRPRYQVPLVSPQLRGNVALKASQPFDERVFD